MSFEVYIQCFGRSELTGIPRDAVRILFPVLEAEPKHDRWKIRYDEKNSCHISVDPLPSNAKMLISLCVERPCGHEKLWEALISVLRMGDVVMFWPGGPPVVSGADIASRLPEEFIAGIGPAVAVQRADEILQLLRQT